VDGIGSLSGEEGPFVVFKKTGNSENLRVSLTSEKLRPAPVEGKEDLLHRSAGKKLEKKRGCGMPSRERSIFMKKGKRSTKKVTREGEKEDSSMISSRQLEKKRKEGQRARRKEVKRKEQKILEKEKKQRLCAKKGTHPWLFWQGKKLGNVLSATGGKSCVAGGEGRKESKTTHHNREGKKSSSTRNRGKGAIVSLL